eukprot:gene15839-biopygen1165
MEGGWVKVGACPRPLQPLSAEAQLRWVSGLGEGVQRTERWQQPAYADGNWIDNRPQTAAATGIASATHLWRRGHDWRVRLAADRSLTWVADDVVDVQTRLLHRIAYDPTLQPATTPCRRRSSAEYAIAMWATERGLQMAEQRVSIVGTCDEDGRQRACPARRFFSAITAEAAQGRGIPLVPTSKWLGRLQVDGRSVWDICDDRSLLKLVPPAQGDPQDLAPILEYVLHNLLRCRPFDTEFLRPRGMVRPDIARVELGDGWVLPGEDPKPGNELIIRCIGGHDWCWHAGACHGYGPMHLSSVRGFLTSCSQIVAVKSKTNRDLESPNAAPQADMVCCQRSRSAPTLLAPKLPGVDVARAARAGAEDTSAPRRRLHDAWSEALASCSADGAPGARGFESGCFTRRK